MEYGEDDYIQGSDISCWAVALAKHFGRNCFLRSMHWRVCCTQRNTCFGPRNDFFCCSCPESRNVEREGRESVLRDFFMCLCPLLVLSSGWSCCFVLLLVYVAWTYDRADRTRKNNFVPWGSACALSTWWFWLSCFLVSFFSTIFFSFPFCSFSFAPFSISFSQVYVYIMDMFPVLLGCK